MKDHQKFLSVESIRGLACFMVLMSHLSLTFFPFMHALSGKADKNSNYIQSIIHESPFGFFYSGTSAVYIFFVLSGFILSKVALKGNGSADAIVRMFLKRYPRLMFPALISCVIAFATFHLFSISTSNLSEWIAEYGNFHSSLLGAVYNGMFDVFFISGRSPYNPVLWTMKIELIGSFIIYLLCLNIISAKKVPYLPFMLFIMISASIVLKIISPRTGAGMISFVGGFFMCLYGKKINNIPAFFTLMLGLYFAGSHNDSSSYSLMHKVFGGLTYHICNFASGFLIVYAIIYNKKLDSFLSSKLFVFMGKVSFSVYLIQLPIIATVSVSLFNLFFKYTGMYNMSAVLSAIISIIFIYAASIVFYKWIDCNGMKYSNVIAEFAMVTIRRISNRFSGSLDAR